MDQIVPIACLWLLVKEVLCTVTTAPAVFQEKKVSFLISVRAIANIPCMSGSFRDDSKEECVSG